MQITMITKYIHNLHVMVLIIILFALPLAQYMFYVGLNQQKYSDIPGIDGFPMVKILEFRELSCLCLGTL